LKRNLSPYKMKKIVLLSLIFVFSALLVSAQDKTQQYIDISETVGIEMANNFQHVEAKLKELSQKDSIVILFLPLYNSKGEFTDVSKNLSERLSSKLQEKIRGQFSRFNLITVEYSKNFNHTADFYLTSNYSITDQKIIIENIILKKPDKAEQISLPLSEFNLSLSLSDDDKVIYKKEHFYIIADETNFYNKTNFVETAIKNSLTINKYPIESSLENSDCKLTITANSSEDKKVYGVHFSKVNVSVQIFDIKTNNSIFFQSYEQSGGSYTSFDDAAKNAFNEISPFISDEVLKFLSTK